jgi:hypothetical protein
MLSNLYHIAYVSTAKDGLRYDDISGILEIANKNNKLRGVTGVLVYCNKHFFQILEGQKELVIDLYNEISTDARHDNIIKLQENEISDRNFASWSMAFKSYNKELRTLDNFNNEQFYSYVKTKISSNNNVSLKILADFFDLNG